MGGNTMPLFSCRINRESQIHYSPILSVRVPTYPVSIGRSTAHSSRSAGVADWRATVLLIISDTQKAADRFSNSIEKSAHPMIA
jgi:hypothetical protein